ncbi:MAG: hypothetical protein RQ714_09420, partial [Nitrosomonas sp.]|nr:hypothetical protein [Nitrosomonas sp.]
LALAVALSQQQVQDQCVYQAGIASRVQEIRQQGETWEQFKIETDKIYQDDEGYKNLLSIGYLVYDQIPAEMNADDVFQVIYDSCIAGHYRKHKKGNEYES